MSKPHQTEPPSRTVLWVRLLLLIPFVAMLWVSSYNRVAPSIAGVPFFYWYQLAWVIIGAVIIGVVYTVEH